MPPEIIGMMAATPEGIVGKNGALPWHYPGELEWFRQSTKTHAVIMGRKTFMAMPARLFDDRTPIVFSRHSNEIQKTKTVSDKESFYALIEHLPKEQKRFMIGGAKLAHFFLKENMLSEFFLTRIHKSYAGDTRIDLELFKGWRETEMITTPDYTIVRLQNPATPSEDRNAD